MNAPRLKTSELRQQKCEELRRALAPMDVSELLKKNVSSTAISSALDSLAQAGRARYEKVRENPEAKKPSERWFALSHATNLTKFTNLIPGAPSDDRINSLNSLISYSDQTKNGRPPHPDDFD